MPSRPPRARSSLVALERICGRASLPHRNLRKGPAMRLIVSLLACFVLIAPARAAETRTVPAGHAPPPATVAQLDWLVGTWTGEGIGGARATEVYSPPGAGSLAGHFVQEDGQGGIEFFELMQIAEVEGSLVYRLKHFTNELVG